jgi:hypothetical protein
VFVSDILLFDGVQQKLVSFVSVIIIIKTGIAVFADIIYQAFTVRIVVHIDKYFLQHGFISYAPVVKTLLPDTALGFVDLIIVPGKAGFYSFNYFGQHNVPIGLNNHMKMVGHYDKAIDIEVTAEFVIGCYVNQHFTGQRICEYFGPVLGYGGDEVGDVFFMVSFYAVHCFSSLVVPLRFSPGLGL